MKHGEVDVFPEIDEFVIATVLGIQDYGVEVCLDEYENMPGFIHISEVTSGWVKRIRDFVREKQKIVAKVLKIEKTSGIVNLSIRLVNAHQKREKIKQWKNENKAKRMFQSVAETLKKELNLCYNEFGNMLIETYDGLYNAFEKAAISHESFEKKYEGEWVHEFINEAEKNIPIHNIEIKGYFDIKCFKPEGIDYIREALLEGEKIKDVSITYISAPKYMAKVKARTYKIAENKIKKLEEKVIEGIKYHGGECIFYRT